MLRASERTEQLRKRRSDVVVVIVRYVRHGRGNSTSRESFLWRRLLFLAQMMRAGRRFLVDKVDNAKIEYVITD